MKKLALLLLFASSISLAEVNIDLTDPKNEVISKMYPEFEFLRVLSFEDTKKNLSIFALKQDKEDEKWAKIFSAKIGSSKVGKQRIYIITANSCTDTEAKYETRILKVNKQNVRFNRYCNGSFFYLTPRNREGNEFLETQFKQSKTVKFEFMDVLVVFNAKGFTAAWDAFGGDAL